MQSKFLSHQAALQAQATAAADAAGQAAIAAASAGRKAAALRMKQKQAQLAPIKGSKQCCQPHRAAETSTHIVPALLQCCCD